MKVSMAQKMATVERVEELLEKLRAASWDHAVKGTTSQLLLFAHSDKDMQCMSSFAFLTSWLHFVPCIKLFPLMFVSTGPRNLVFSQGI